MNPPRTITVLTVIGTRPEAIKMAPVIRELAARGGAVRSVVCVTGQHREMLDQVLQLFEIRPDIDLKVMTQNQTLSRLNARLLESLDGVVGELKPDWVLAQGDTTTVLAAALVSFYHRIRFGHVEAGLRTGNLDHPFPEEMNRRVADVMATAFFAPTDRARKTLLAEGVPAGRIFQTGNTVVDALLDITSRPVPATPAFARFAAMERLVLITAHRRESFGEPFRQLCEAIRELAGRFGPQGVHFVYPVHLNPNVRAPVQSILAGLGNVSLIEPVDYQQLAHLLKRAELVLTDSGGIQEEAPTFGVPVLVMRDTTERPEAVEAGIAHLVGTDRERIVREASRFLERRTDRSKSTVAPNPYGDGRAASRIVDAILRLSLPTS